MAQVLRTVLLDPRLIVRKAADGLTGTPVIVQIRLAFDGLTDKDFSTPALFKASRLNMVQTFDIRELLASECKQLIGEFKECASHSTQVHHFTVEVLSDLNTVKGFGEIVSPRTSQQISKPATSYFIGLRTWKRCAT